MNEEPHVLSPLRRLRAWELMSPATIVVTPGDLARSALDKMGARGFRHLPVVDGGFLIGVVSQRELLDAGRGLRPRVARDLELDPPTVGTLMRSKPVTCPPDATLVQLTRALRRWEVGCLPIVEPEAETKLLGLITSSDALDHWCTLAE